MSEVGIGILGFAHGHVHAYCEQWLADPGMGVRPVAGWDHDPERATQGCERHGIPRAPCVPALLARDDIHAVVIASETSLHADLAEQAAAAGKAIVLQKPMALTMAEADRIVAAVDGSGVPLTMAWQMRVDPQNLKARELVDSGALGRIFMVRRRHCLSTQLWPDFEKSWHVQPSLNRDIFADDASHAIDFVYWLMGMPASVTAELGTLLNPAVPNDNGIAVFRYEDGAFAEVSCSFVALAGENTLEIHGDKGVVIGNYGDGPSTMLPRPPGSVQLKWHLKGSEGWTVSDLPDIGKQWERICGLARPLAEFLRGDRPPIASAEEGRTVLKLVLACYESAESGRRVLLQ
jgi:predicted dehydrogenase